jgi:hypothetical protein
VSTDYCPLKRILACDLFSGCLEKYGVREYVNPEVTTKNKRCLTDGENHVWVFISDDLFVSFFKRCTGNRAGKILRAVAFVFDTDVVSEDEGQFWSYETKEEWEENQLRIQIIREKKSHIEILKYCRGEANEIMWDDMRRAEIARSLVDKHPSLLLPINEEKLFNEIKKEVLDREIEDFDAYLKRSKEEGKEEALQLTLMRLPRSL